MEGNAREQLPTLSEPVSHLAYDAHEGCADIFWESPVSPPQDHAPHGMMSNPRSAFGQQLFDMQQQLASVITGQHALRAQVGEIHVAMNALVAHTIGRNQMDGARIGDVAKVSEKPHGDKNSGRYRRSLSRYTNTTIGSRFTNLTMSSRSDGKHRARAVMPFQRQFIKKHKQPGNESPQASYSLGTRSITQFTQLPSRNAFGSKTTTQSDDMDMLFELFRVAEEDIETSAESADQSHHVFGSMRSGALGQQKAGVVIDSLFGVVIALNAVFIGVRIDQVDAKHLLWTIIDMGFTGVFLIEIGWRVWMHGFRNHFCGSSRVQNMFDASLVLIDVIQQAIEFAFAGESDRVGGVPSASLFRIGRLGKLARMLHLLRLSIFTDLLTMLHGMLGGMTTLGWSMVLFVVAIYIVALFFREFFGNGDVPNVTEMFSSVPRSMFTTFRCSFGDCSSSRGVPIFEYVNMEYGGFASLLYCSFLFVITIGLFNVISAIFVDSTMQAASSLQVQKKKERLRDQNLWCKNVNILVKRLVSIAEGDRDGEIRLTEHVREMYFLEVPCAAIDELAQDPEAIAALSALDIAPEDRDFLSDILDPDNGGTINVIEIVEGLRMLRGDPRRSDMVTINLVLRSVQRDLAEMFDMLRKVQDTVVSKTQVGA